MEGASASPGNKCKIFEANLKTIPEFLELNVGIFGLCAYKQHKFSFLGKQEESLMVDGV
jgi:hypothetical protein